MPYSDAQRMERDKLIRAMRMATTITKNLSALVALLGVAFAANAQRPVTLQHLAPEEMSRADRAVIEAHHAELSDAANIYGYNLSAGNWIYRQSVCPAMPETILLQYDQQFPDGAESLFTALVPRSAGRIRIVPILYRNATTITPAAGNPRNYELFNQLVPASIASGSVKPGRDAVQLGICYAEMTGATIGDWTIPATADVPAPISEVDTQGNTARVVVTGAQGRNTYQQWDVAFNKEGRVTAVSAGTYGHGVVEQTLQIQAASSAGEPELSHPGSASSQPAGASSETSEQNASESNVQSASVQATSAPAETGSAQSSRTAATTILEPGWKVVPPAPEPKWKVVPAAPLPPVKIIPAPSGEPQ